MATTATMLTAGDTLAGYRIEDVIGWGGMAVVYRAEQISLGRRVALKVLAPQLSSDEAFRERFRREGKHAAMLDHPHVVTIHDSGDDGGRLYMAMRLVEGTTLADRMSAGKGLSAQDTASLLTPIADALDAAHSIGLIHRDVKPQNILIAHDGHPYLADFGVARATTASAGLTATGGFVGSINYASPEQITGSPATAAGDIYALTAVLYQCLTGEVPYPRESEAGVMHAHLHAPPPTLAPLAGQARALNRVIARGMAKDPAERYERASELFAEASAAISSLPETRRLAAPAFPAGPGGHPAGQYASGDVGPGAHPEPSGDAGLSAAVAGDESDPRPRALRVGATEIVSPAERSVRELARDRTSADQRRAPVAAEPAPTASRRRVSPKLVAAAVVAVTAFAGGVVAITAGGGRSTASGLVRSGPISLAYHSPWKPTAARSAAAVALASPALLEAGDAILAAGALGQSAVVPGNPPPQLVARYAQPSSSTTVRVGAYPAKRDDWKLAGGRPLVVFVLATAGGDLAVTCAPHDSTPKSLAPCTALAATTRVTGAPVLSPGPDPQLGGALTRDLGAVSVARRHLGRLGASALPARAATAEALARVERAEAKALAAAPRFARNRVAAGRLAAALSFEAGRLDVLGRAAAADQRVAYAAARLAVLRAGAGLVAALSAVAGEGFAVPGLSPLRLPGLPQPAPARSLGLPAPVSPAPTPVAPPPPPPAYRTPVRPVAPSHQSSGPTFGQTKTVQTF